MRILVDADACPVKEEVSAIGNKHVIEIVFFASVSHNLEKYSTQGVKLVQVDNHSEAADIRLANETNAGDIVISADYGLAALVLAKKGSVLTPRGLRITEQNIDTLLQDRFFAAKVRREGGKQKGPRAFSNEDRRKFCQSLQTLVRSY